MRPVASCAAHEFICRHHYSGRSVNNSQLHFGVYWHGQLEGVLQYGPPMVKRNVLPLVEGTPWNGMIELNRMAFTDALPRNSESRAIAITLRLLRKRYPHLEWVLCFADGTQCGDGTIYRASGFALTGINRNQSIVRLPDGSVGCKMTYGKNTHALAQRGRAGAPKGSVTLKGFQLRYIYFLHPGARARLAVPELPYSAIRDAGAAMAKGTRPKLCDGPVQGHSGGEAPTRTLQHQEATA